MKALVPAAVLLALVLGVSGCSSTTENDPHHPSTNSSPSPEKPELDFNELDLPQELSGCENLGSSLTYQGSENATSSDCQFLTPLLINHETYGDSWFVLGSRVSADAPELAYWLLSADGQLFEHRSGEGDASRYLEAPQLDGSGNIIYTFNPGRSDGCVALRPEGVWFADFGTDPLQVPEGELDYLTRFYGCQWTDEDGDGTKEILYMPTGGATENPQPMSYKWNGSGYVEDGYRPFPDGSWLPGYGPEG